MSTSGADVKSSVPTAVAGGNVIADIARADVAGTDVVADVEPYIPAAIAGGNVVADISRAEIAGADVVADAAGGADTSSMYRSSGLSSTSSSLQTSLHQPTMLEGNHTY